MTNFRVSICVGHAGALALMIITLVSTSASDAAAKSDGFFDRLFKPRTLTSYASLVETRGGAQTKCFPRELKAAIAKIGQRFGDRPVVVSSGYRSPGRNRRAGGARRSYHLKCMAADIRIAGVAKHKIARYARSLRGVGGVGTYSCNGVVHVDVGPKRNWHHRCGRRR